MEILNGEFGYVVEIDLERTENGWRAHFRAEQAGEHFVRLRMPEGLTLTGVALSRPE